MPLVSFHSPSKNQKITQFLIFSGGIEKDISQEMGSYETKYSRVDKVNFVEDSLEKDERIWSA